MDSPTEAVQSAADMMQQLLLNVTRFDRYTADRIGINATDLLCLSWLERRAQPVTAKALADFLGISTGSTTALIDRLEKRGLLQRAPHPTDRRGITLQPGPAAATPEIVGLRNRARALMADAWSAFTPAELMLVQRFLLATTTAIDEQIVGWSES
ncbi:MAG: MarR family winged helix-turn-helix transcriptional regulator [Devosia sp.]